MERRRKEVDARRAASELVLQSRKVQGVYHQMKEFNDVAELTLAKKVVQQSVAVTVTEDENENIRPSK